MRVLNSSTAIHIFIVLILVPLSLGIFWLLIEAPKHSHLQDIEQNKARWNLSNIKNYDYEFLKGCMFYDVNTVKVRNGLMLKGQYDHSISFLFDKAETITLSAHAYSIEYNPLGFVSGISVDWQKHVFDDECFYKIRNFRVVLNPDAD